MALSNLHKRCFLVVLVLIVLVLFQFLYSNRNRSDLHSSSSLYGCKECQEIYPVSPYTEVTTNSHFNDSHDFKVISFPFNKFVRSMDYMLHTKWVHSIQKYLKQLAKKQVIYTVSLNEKYLGSLLNWLSAVRLHTQIPFINILILALDRDVYKSLKRRGIASILLDNDDIIRPNASFRSSAAHVWIKRCTVTRLLNHWGYDVIMFDLDAIVFKDPKQLFQIFNGSDIVGSRGTFPRDLYHRWGLTLCMGVVMFRSTSAVETFWETASVVDVNLQDDQVKMNNVLQHLHVKWFASEGCKDIKNCTALGITKNKLKVTIVSHDLICRACDEHHIDNYYIWHIHARKSMRKEEAKKFYVWYLKDDWNNIWQTSPAMGEKLIDLLTRTNAWSIAQ